MESRLHRMEASSENRRPSRLALVAFYCGCRIGLLDPLSRELASTFQLAVERHPPAFDPELAYDDSRGQYNSRILLAQLLRHHCGHDRVLAVTDVDLFIPVLTFVIGEAQLGGRLAVVSTQRLAPENYGLPSDATLLEARLVKEAIHELGHTYGLVHCSADRCVMASSPRVEGIDLKSSRFCPRCRRLIA